MKKAILYQPWGGLGDNMQFSTLPEEYSKIGIDFYLSHKNTYHNPEIFDLVWKLNPYVKGIIEESPNIGSCMVENKRFPTPDYISWVEKFHGLPGTSKYPRLYYRTNKQDYMKDYTILCLSSMSVPYDKKILKEYIEKLLCNTFNENIYIIIFKNKEKINSISKHVHYIFDFFEDKFKKLEVSSIFEYCDIICSCNRIITLNSGQLSLSSALKQFDNMPMIDVLTPKFYEGNNLYRFDNCNYHWI